MASLAEKILDAAQADVGLHENPMGSNHGDPCPHKYQDPWGSWMRGQPWCGAAVAYWWTKAGADGMDLADPSTATMCNIAKRDGLTKGAKPGCCFVECSVHTGLLYYDMGGGVWKTIEGNTSDQVAYRQRSLSGMVLYGPPNLGGAATPADPQQTVYAIEDVRMKGVREWGGWSSKSARDDAYHDLKRRLGYELRVFKRVGQWGLPKNVPYFVEDVRQPLRWYGPWTSKASRDNALGSLEKNLGYDLRTLSYQRDAPSGAQADAPGKVD